MENLIKPSAEDREVTVEGEDVLLCRLFKHDWESQPDDRPILMTGNQYHAKYPETWRCSRCGRTERYYVRAML